MAQFLPHNVYLRISIYSEYMFSIYLLVSVFDYVIYDVLCALQILSLTVDINSMRAVILDYYYTDLQPRLLVLLLIVLFLLICLIDLPEADFTHYRFIS